jgi:hypothetical protein
MASTIVTRQVELRPQKQPKIETEISDYYLNTFHIIDIHDSQANNHRWGFSTSPDVIAQVSIAKQSSARDSRSGIAGGRGALPFGGATPG